MSRAASEKAGQRVIWITGASGGLGSHLVREFHSQGDAVIASYHTRHSFPEDERLQSVQLDITRSESVQTAYDQIVSRWGRVDVLINNAGVTRDRLLAQMSEPDWEEVMRVNLRGTFLCARAAIPALIANGGGHIVNITSFSAKRGHAGQTNYAAAKAAVLGLTQSLAQELGKDRIQVNAVMPGVLLTGMTGALSSERLKAFAAENALGRLNDLEEVARFIGFLTTMKNVSGQIFQLDSRISRWT